MAAPHSYSGIDQPGDDRLLLRQQSSPRDARPPHYQYSSSHGSIADKAPRLSIMREEDGLHQEVEPRRIQRSKTDLLVDIVMFLIPICFSVLLVFTVSRHGRPMDSTYNALENATKVASTIFPLAFAAVVGNAIKQVARLRLETGAPLGLLEQLMGSRTVFGTLVTQYQIKYSTSLGLLLILLWALSPLGGQAAIRFLNHANVTDLFTNGTITYFDTTLAPGEGLFKQLGKIYSIANLTQSQYIGNISALISSGSLMYKTTIMSTDSAKINAVDAWGNVKIPMLSAGLHDDGTDWTFYNESTHLDRTYSALVGIPIAHLPAGTISSSIQSAYIELACDNFSSVLQPVPAKSTCLQSAFKQYDRNGQLCSIPNGTWQSMFTNQTSSTTWSISLDQFVSPETANLTKYITPTMHDLGLMTRDVLRDETYKDFPQATLLFQSYNHSIDTPPKRIINTSCKVAQRYVESAIQCSGSNSTTTTCNVVAQRRSQKAHAIETLSLLSWPAIFGLVSLQPFATISSVTGEDWISAPDLYYLRGLASADILDMSKIMDSWQHYLDPGVFEVRLAQLLNTCLLLSTVDSMNNPGFLVPHRELTSNTTVITIFDRYSISWPWAGVWFLAIVGMFAAAVTGIMHRYKATSPDVIGYCSTMTRNNKYMALPLGTGIMDGMELANKFRMESVRFGVVDRTDEGIGILGIARSSDVESVRRTDAYL